MRQNNSTKRTIEKQKKLLIKKIMSWVRQSFNNRQIGFHPFVLCVSIKPSINQRCATIQSYPNQELWKSLHSLQDQELLQQIIQEVSEKTFKLKEKYDYSIIQEFLNRIKNNFDFCKFYKDTQDINFDSDEHVSNSTELNENFQIKQFQKSESESKQLLQQIELCNSKKGSIITIEKQHYHKLSQLFEKICLVPKQLQSIEMKKFKNQLQLLLESTQNPKEKQICVQNEFQTEKVPNSIQNLDIYVDQLKNKFQQEIIDEVLQIAPGLVLFLPSFENTQVNNDELKQVEQDFFQEILYQKIMAPQNLTPQNIIFAWRYGFEPKIKEILDKFNKIKTE
ncbi:unnamed protein product [Paramecium primaurelia]|uniref:Uncharacterized protein n=1 Tax=Paramecium primaurelia TaxID=5886 RepID=A0A8S1NJR0_PARPR|nr:unnamed protein product [Paramecium primaurelia]